MAAKGSRRTTTIQVSPSLNLVITKYATEQGLGKAEAADRIFSILYPKGVPGEPETSLEPPGQGGDEDSAGGSNPLEDLEGEGEEGEDISDELNKTVKDLRTVQTIRALTGNLSGKGDDDKITAKDALELRKIEAMYGPKAPAAGTDALDATFQKYVAPLQDQIKALEAKISEKSVADAEKRASEAEKKLEERDARDQRQMEIQAVIDPILEKVGELDGKLGALGETLKPGSKEPVTSEELKAINTVAAEIRNLVQKLGTAGGGEGGGKNVSDLMDELLTVLDKVNAFKGKFGGGGEGDFDWRAATISTIGEVTTEALHTFREINAPPLGSEEGEEGGGDEAGKQEETSQKLILRRVYNYALKKIEEGELQLNPYDAAKELKLTPNQVWWAIDTLRKRGLLKSEKATTEKKGGEGELGREADTGLPPGVEG